MLLACTVFTSCLNSNEEEITLYNDAAITEMTLGNLIQRDPVTHASTVLTGSVYQIGYTISNRYSLPVGTVVNGITCTLSTKNSSGVIIRQLADTTNYDWYSSSLEIDFSQPRLFRVISTDGSYVRTYTVTLNVKKTATKTFWTTAGDTTLLGGFDNLRLMAVDTMLIAFGEQSGALTVCRSTNQGKSWKALVPDVTLSADAWKNMVARNDTLFVLDSNTLLCSTDGEQWQQKGTGLMGLKQLVGVSTDELFAISTDSMMMVSGDNGANWTADQTDSSLSTDSVKHLLGLRAIASTTFPYAPVNNADYVLLMGHDGTKTVVWRKISRRSEGTTTGQWVNIPAESLNKYALNKQDNLSLAYYDSKVLAFGTDTIVRQSADQGITWQENKTYALPDTVQTAVVDGKGVLWAIAKEGVKGKVLRGSVY